MNAICHRCRAALLSGARFCGRCGARRPDHVSQRITSLTQDEGLVALILTLVWVFGTVFFASHPLFDTRAAVILFVVMLALMTPVIVPLFLALHWTRVAVNRTHGADAEEKQVLSPAVVVVVALAWLAVSLLLFSEPSADFYALMGWFAFTFGLAVSWLALLSVAYRALRVKHWTIPRRARVIAGYLAPVPVAAVVLILCLAYEVPLRTRFELSEDALHNEIQRNDGDPASFDSHRVGLYHVKGVQRRDGCIVIETGGVSFEMGGFAYCTGPLPDSRNVNMDHLTGRWWKYTEIID
jgi:hypothetical protein